MQRLAGGFMVNRVVMLHVGNGNISELYELPNGQWQFGKDRDATVIQRIDQVFKLPAQSRWVDGADISKGYLTVVGKDAQDQILEEFHPFGELGDVKVLQSLEAWLLKVKARAEVPAPMQAGPKGNQSSTSPRAMVHEYVDHMNDETVSRMLNSLEMTLGPIQDSLRAKGLENSHGDGYGDPETFAPGDTTVSEFQLPQGAEWVDPQRPASGYFTFDSNIRDERGQRTKNWHPTPEFERMAFRAETGSSLDAIPPKVHDPVQAEIEAERNKQPQVAGSRSRTAKSSKR